MIAARSSFVQDPRTTHSNYCVVFGGGSIEVPVWLVTEADLCDDDQHIEEDDDDDDSIAKVIRRNANSKDNNSNNNTRTQAC